MTDEMINRWGWRALIFALMAGVAFVATRPNDLAGCEEIAWPAADPNAIPSEAIPMEAIVGMTHWRCPDGSEHWRF